MMIGSQDYPAVDLLISDNGQNGTKVDKLVEASNYSRPYHIRHNPVTVDIIQHFNQIIKAASGYYFFILNDDDEISSNFISELVRQLERYPQATMAMAKQQIIGESGAILRSSKTELPEILGGPDFIRAVWKTYEFGFENVESFFTRTELLRETGGYADFAKGNHSDDAAVIRLSLNGHVVLNSECTYRHRVHRGGYGWLASITDLADATRGFLRWLDRDAVICRFADAHPDDWKDLKQCLVRMSWETYLWRWRDIYKHRLRWFEWIREAFRMPFLPGYYRKVVSILWDSSKAWLKSVLTGQPQKRRDFFQESKSSDKSTGSNEDV